MGPVSETTEDPCNDPDASIRCSFDNMPSNLSELMNISSTEEPGEKLSITGKVYKGDEKTPYPGVILYAYHTDHKGYYSKKGTEKGVQKWHGYLHGWCKSGSDGNYEIRSIRPARYPVNQFPAHIHVAVLEPGKEPYYINDFVFNDDSLVNDVYISSLRLKGGSGVVDIKRTGDTWRGVRNIIL